MLQNKPILIVAFILPIVILLGITLNAEYNLRTGKEVTFPIKGYDPRDLLSGHYLAYTIDYGFEPCKSKLDHYDAYLCIDSKQTFTHLPNNCQTIIKGTCRFGSFIAGVERFYATENTALNLQSMIRQHPMRVVLSVAKDGTAQVKYLLVGDQRLDFGA